MNTVTDLFQINGFSMLAPDQGVEMSFQDIDAPDAGRDEGGFMHRSVLRRKVGVWNFVYSCLTKQEYAYMRSLIDAAAGSFAFTYPGEDGKPKIVTAYLSGYGICWYSAKTGLYRNLKFSVIEC